MPLFNDDIFLGSAQTYIGTGAFPTSSVFIATISGTTMTVTQSVSGDPIQVGQWLNGAGVTTNTVITNSLGLNALNQQTYQLSISQTVGSATSMTSAGQGSFSDPSPMSLGVGPIGRAYFYDIVPQTLQLANIAASQTPAAAGNVSLTSGISTILVTRSNGQTVIQLDVPRAISITQVSAGTNRNFVISGYDYYGQAMTQTILSTTGATVTTLKAFYQVSGITVDGGTTTAVTVGTSDVFGIPIRVFDGSYIIDIGWAGAIATDPGTWVPAVTTSPATNATGDVRGTYKPSTASNGIKRLVFSIELPANISGPNANRVGALGVTQA